MTIFCVYTGADLNSYICELTLAKGRGATLPVYRMQLRGPRRQSGTWQDPHPSTFFGSVTVIMRGRTEVSVTGGERRTVRAKAGDIFIYLDTEGAGHGISNPDGGELFQSINMRLADSIEDLWGALQEGFNGWPCDILPPKTYRLGGPPDAFHTEPKPDAAWETPTA